ncbi:hypothetical protein AMAG_04848 [Allomyces macrogynus ATCC 38327]|uniref:Uncharacterized protein n=1 Tax=Allomyces macrogynus (strain ATCC 38327) TaxID=578462 RepID=A0A0L0S6A1_ALLM3|nr:hypothetical protein AMAG_04848 [Allomyces macrogynus ATCC 38327]|eukprot:KNE58022.1 hypothetical protein AMAG_04848 [Allomyces macrogynus ATCC 38327]
MCPCPSVAAFLLLWPLKSPARPTHFARLPAIAMNRDYPHSTMPDPRSTHDPAPAPQAPSLLADGPTLPLTSLLEPHDSRRSRNLVVAIDKYLAVSLDLISPANLAPIFAQLAHDQPELVEALTAQLRASVQAKATAQLAEILESRQLRARLNTLDAMVQRAQVQRRPVPTTLDTHVMTPAQIDEAVRVATKRTHAEELRAKVDELEAKVALDRRKYEMRRQRFDQLTLTAQASIDMSGPEMALANGNASDVPVPR